MHEKFMLRCLDLAAKGIGLVSPNPLVGSVITLNNKIIAEGYHFCYGGPHAERVAIGRVNELSQLRESTLYVNLEPCNHHGKTPPCTELIIESGIPRVVVGCMDPNPLVAGSGIARLRDAGVEVSVGILQSESKELNRRFITWIEKDRPYIILKWAETQDGFIDKDRTEGDRPLINWITSPTLRSLVHRWRSEEDAILVGAKTLIRDNPQLTVRDWYGSNPLRICIENRGTLPCELAFFDDKARSIVFSDKESPAIQSGASWFRLDTNDLQNAALRMLKQQGIASLIIEGGAQTLNRFIDLGLWDEARVFTGNIRFGSGVKAPNLSRQEARTFQYGAEKLEIIRNG
jgi:diaminohydroxyphosphoribosylaminopyrimidine deaminase / 5-amino-6-(5-phosphoribosylamino)uracil reductase